MSKLALRIQSIGPAGLAALALFAGAALFLLLVVHPLQARHEALRVPAQAGGARSAEKLAEFYRFLESGEATTDALAKLHAIGTASGVQLQSATYSTRDAGARLERYEMVLPLTGSYAQIRDFLKRSLADIPALSLDQMSLKRASRADGAIQAELRLTLHRVKS